jgi:hypothetical protein
MSHKIFVLIFESLRTIELFELIVLISRHPTWLDYWPLVSVIYHNVVKTDIAGFDDARRACRIGDSGKPLKLVIFATWMVLT